ncbi:hypothetical protein D3C81_1404450 [compost metagenome]
MAHKKLTPIKNPQLWYQEQKNGLVEAVIIENFGKGPVWYRLWVPANSDDAKVRNAIVKRMSHDHGIQLDHWSRLLSNTSPLTDELVGMPRCS